MALLDDLMTQVLAETRVVTNAPVLAPGEPLRVDIVPGGVPLADAVSGLTSPLLADLSLSVTYKLMRGSDDITMTTRRVPQTPDPFHIPNSTTTLPAAELLSVAFMLPPILRTRPAALPALGLPAGLPPPPPPSGITPPPPPAEGTLTVTLALVVDVGSGPQPRLTRDVVIPFFFPQLDLPVIPPALCLMSPDANLEGKYSVLLLAPGSGTDVAQAVTTINQIVVLLGQLGGLVEKIGAVIAPLRHLLDALSALPAPQTSNAGRVDLDEDFSEYDDIVDTGLDNLMSSYIAVGPSGTVLRLGHDDDDDPLRDVTLIDVLDMPSTPPGRYLLGQLGVTVSDAQAAADALTPLLGGAKLGIGAALCLDLDSPKPDDDQFRTYTNGDSMNNDLGRVTWRLAPITV